MNSHTIVYLDQNYLSNMAKAQHGFIKDEDEAIFWCSLFDDLKRAVLADRVACPEAEFHLTEAKYNERLWKPIIEIINILSGGLQLRPWKSILESQIEDAARQFLGVQPAKRESWSIAFESDPHSKYIDRIQSIKNTKIINYIHLPLIWDDIEHDRQLKLGFVGKKQKMLEEYARKPLGWPELLLDSKKGVIDGFMGKLAEQSIYEKIEGDYPLEDKLIAIDNYNRLKNFWDCIHRIGVNPKDYDMVNNFARSNELLNSSFVDINGSIWAVIAERFIQGRKPREGDLGDLYDVPILAVALPYCGIVTTDSTMKKILVNRLHFDDKYNTKIFSATKVDLLAFQKCIRDLSTDT